MRHLLVLLMLWPLTLHAQTREVDPEDLQLTVKVLEQAETPYAREMVMILIRGVYQRHITREKLEQPDLPGALLNVASSFSRGCPSPSSCPSSLGARPSRVAWPGGSCPSG